MSRLIFRAAPGHGPRRVGARPAASGRGALMRHAPAAALLAGVFLLAACASELAETEGTVTLTSVSPAARARSGSGFTRSRRARRRALPRRRHGVRGARHEGDRQPGQAFAPREPSRPRTSTSRRSSTPTGGSASRPRDASRPRRPLARGAVAIILESYEHGGVPGARRRVRLGERRRALSLRRARSRRGRGWRGPRARRGRGR